MNEIKVGDKVYEVVKNGLREHTVCKVGRKYFYLEGDHQETPFDIKTLIYQNKDHSQWYKKLWRTVEEYENYVNQKNMLNELRETLFPREAYKENPKLPKKLYLQICELLNIKSTYKAKVIK